MRFTFILLIISVLYILNATPLHAEETPTPTPVTTQSTNEFTVQNKPSTIITILKNFIDGFDSLLGGFIFYTPDPLGNKITLKDSTEIVVGCSSTL